jgi:transcription initiation factor TFIIH subunit 2
LARIVAQMRHAVLVVDMSAAMGERDFSSTRLEVTRGLLEKFVKEFFDQNPIGHLGLVVTRDKRAEKVCELTSNARTLSDGVLGLSGEKAVSGEASLQNALELAVSWLKQTPSHSSREILVVFASLSTCDPSNMDSTIQLLKLHRVKTSVVGLSAEVYVCKRLSKETGGEYAVAMDETHIGHLLSGFLPPPPATRDADSNLVKMGFPHHQVCPSTRPSACQW